MLNDIATLNVALAPNSLDTFFTVTCFFHTRGFRQLGHEAAPPRMLDGIDEWQVAARTDQLLVGLIWIKVVKVSQVLRLLHGERKMKR